MIEGMEAYDAVVVGGGPAGATAAWDLAKGGRSVLLIDKAGRIKPCGGAVPPRLIRDFDIPESLIVARANAARMIAPSGREVDMPIEGGSVGMVDREHFDEGLRARAALAGAVRVDGAFVALERDEAGRAVVRYEPKGAEDGETRTVRARLVVGADGARSKVARQALGEDGEADCVFAYHEIIRSPAGETARAQGFDGARCDIY